MKLEKLKKNVGWRMELAPPACHLDSHGVALPERNEDWIVKSVTDDIVELTAASGHVLLLGTDAIYSFYSNPQKPSPDGHNGILSLHLQVFVQGANIFVKPNARPGERVSAAPIAIIDKAVSLDYPTRSGMQYRLAAEGYRLSWPLESRVDELVDLHGWEIVVEPDTQGRLCRYRCKNPGDDHVLVKKRTQ